MHEGFGPETDDIEVGQEILNYGEPAVGSGDSVVPGGGGGVGVALSVPVVAEIGLAVGDGVSQVQENGPACVVAGPGWEITLHVQLEPGIAHGGADEPKGIGFGLVVVGLHGGVAIGGVQSDLTSGPHVYHLYVLVLEQVSDLYPGDVVEGVFELIIGSEGGGEGYVEGIGGYRIGGYVLSLVGCVEFVCNGAGRAPPDLGVEGVGAVVLLVGVGHTSQLEIVAGLGGGGSDHDDVLGGVGVALAVGGHQVASCGDRHLRIIFDPDPVTS